MDEGGALVFQVLRYSPKSFKQRRPGGWIWNTTDVLPVPYRLPGLVEAIANDRPVFIVEGEKDCDNLANLAKLDIVATCNGGGAGKWKSKHAAYLKGADVVVLPDNDEQGRKHAEMVASSLQGIAERVRVLALSGLAQKGDVSDWLQAGGTVEHCGGL